MLVAHDCVGAAALVTPSEPLQNGKQLAKLAVATSNYCDGSELVAMIARPDHSSMSLTLAPTQQNWFPISPNTEPGQQYLLPPAMVSSWPEGQVALVGSSDPSMNRKPELESELPPPETAPEVLVVPETCCASEGRAQNAVAAKTAAVL